MRLVEFIDGALELRWTWLPYWLAANGKLKVELETELREAVQHNALTTADADLDWLNDYLCRRIQARFPGFDGLGDALRAFRGVRPPPGVV